MSKLRKFTPFQINSPPKVIYKIKNMEQSAYMSVIWRNGRIVY
jgi:hypothetical protein